MTWLSQFWNIPKSSRADRRAPEQDLPPVEHLESRICLGSMTGATVADWSLDQTDDLSQAMEVFREDEAAESRADLENDNPDAEATPSGENESPVFGSSQTSSDTDAAQSTSSLLGTTLSNLQDESLATLSSFNIEASSASDATPKTDTGGEPAATSISTQEAQAAANYHNDSEAADATVAAVTDQTSRSTASTPTTITSDALAGLGLQFDSTGAVVGLADSSTAAGSGYDAWWNGAEEPVVLRYDFRDQGGFANEITAEQKGLAEQALQRWSDATEGKIVFVHDTDVPSSQIINIGTGDVAAFGHVSGVGGVMGLGGGRVELNENGQFVASGVAWLDHGETWDTTLGNGDPDNTVDFSTVVSHEIGHAIGYGDAPGSDKGDMMFGRYTGERDLSAIDKAAENGHFYRTLETGPASEEASEQGFEVQPLIPASAMITTTEVEQLLKRGAAASASNDAIIAIVDRSGRVLGVRVEADALTAIPDTDTLVFAIDGAIAKARTAAMFSNGDPSNGTLAPLTSRTVRFLSQSTITQREVESNPNHDRTSAATAAASTTRGPGFVAPIGVGGHFPPDIPFTPLVDLFGIEHTNRDSNLHPGADGIRGTADDFDLRTDGNADPALKKGRFNIDPTQVPNSTDPNFVPVDNGLYAPESWGHEQNSGDLEAAQSRGIATLPGGIPLFKDTNADGFGDTLVGGVGVFFPGSDGYATHEQGFVAGVGQTTLQRTNAARVLEAEYIAFVVGGGSLGAQVNFGVAGASIGTIGGVAPVGGFDLPFGRLDLVGLTLEVYGPRQGKWGVVDLLEVGDNVGAGNSASGADQQFGGGEFYRAGLQVPEGWLVTPHASAVDAITAADVTTIINQGILAANEVRAAVRLPLNSRTRMVFAVTDSTGEVLGLYRMQDATTFSIDVAVAKARNVAYYADATDLKAVDKVVGVEVGVAFTNRTFRYLAQPRFPSGIDETDPPQFSILNDDSIDHLTAENTGAAAAVSAFTSVLGHDAFFPMTNFRDPGDATVVADAGAAPLANQNGIVFFPGSTPLYKSGTLIGGFGVSGDGVDQDDVVTFVGATGFEARGNATRADERFVDGVRLPFQHFLRNPWG